jgi:hypothetical protein
MSTTPDTTSPICHRHSGRTDRRLVRAGRVVPDEARDRPENIVLRLECIGLRPLWG